MRPLDCTFLTAFLVLAAGGSQAQSEAPSAMASPFQEARTAAHGQWIELESGRAQRRVFVATTGKTGPGGVERIHLRYDHAIGSREPGPPTIVRTLDLDCRHSQTTLVALHGFDENGKKLFSQGGKKEKPELVLNFYESPLRLVCTREYLIPMVTDGAAYYEKAKREFVAEAKAAIPDRPIPVIE